MFRLPNRLQLLLAPLREGIYRSSVVNHRTRLTLNTCEERVVPALAAIDWIRQFGTPSTDAINSVTVDSSSNIYVGGDTNGTLSGQSSAGSTDGFVRKYNSSGTAIWTRQFGTTATDSVNSVAVDSSGNIYVGGYTNGTIPGQSALGNNDCYVRKYNSSGTEIWTRQFGTSDSDYVESVAVDNSGNVYVGGYTSGTLPGQISAGVGDGFVRKYNSSGTEIWTRQIGTNFFDYVNSVGVDNSGNVYIGGRADNTLPGQALEGVRGSFVRKYNSSGTEIWTHQFGFDDFDSVDTVGVDSSGNVYVGGITYGALPGQSAFGNYDCFVRKYNSSGAEIWTRQFGTDDFDSVSSLGVDSLGNVFLGASVFGSLPGQSSAGSTDGFVRKYNSTGSEIWTRQFGTSADDIVSSVAVDSSGNVCVGGRTYGVFPGQTSVGASEDSFLIKFAQLIAPTSLAITGATATSVSLSWNDSNSIETASIIERATNTNFTSGVVTQTLAANSTAATITGLASNTQYYFRVRAVNGADASANSNVVARKTHGIPGSPSNLAVSLMTPTSVSLRWNDNSGVETNMVVERATNSGFTSGLVTQTLAANTTATTFTGLTAGTLYYFRVRAVNGAGASANSNVVSQKPYGIPGAPSNLATPGATATSVNLTWTDNSGVESGFIIERATNATFTSGLTSQTVAANVTSATINGLAPNTTYFFRVRAINAAGASANSNVVTRKTHSIPTAPSSLIALSSTSSTVNLRWNDNSGVETSFVVQRATNATFTTGVVSQSVTANTTTATITGLTSNTRYFFRVQAVNSAGASLFTNTVNIQTTI